jgi:threonyl-tRNA synthetase
MKKIIKAGQRFSRRRFDSLDDAREELADEPYKLELIDLKGSRPRTCRRGRRPRAS